MSCRKCRRWHFQDTQFRDFLGKHAPRLAQLYGTFGTLTFLPPRTPSKLILFYAANCWYLIAYETNAQGRKKRLGPEGVGGGGRGGVHFKNRYCQGGYNFHIIFFISFILGGRGKVLIHHTFLTTPPPDETSVP